MALPTRLLGAARLKWRSLRDYSALRDSNGAPYEITRRYATRPSGAAVGKASGVQLARTGELSNSYAGWRPLEFSSRSLVGSIDPAGNSAVISIKWRSLRDSNSCTCLERAVIPSSCVYRHHNKRPRI